MSCRIPLCLVLIFLVTACGQAQEVTERESPPATAAKAAPATPARDAAGAKSAAADDSKPDAGDEAKDAASEEPDDATPAGHSFHGEAFNAGPRQAAYLMGNTGNVSFPITTENELARKFFNQGVGQLHGFWYFEAERSFRQVAALDSECAMAYWGMAMANTNNSKRASDLIEKAWKLREKASKREKMYIKALYDWYQADSSKSTERAQKYTDALEKLLYEYPDDIEARAFLGLQLWLNRRYKLEIQSHLAVDALLQQVLQENPQHPCHHYVIHLWDHERPENALVSASRCGQAAPGIAHMWHMPGHIYSDLKRYEDAAWQQEASARVDHAHMMRDRVMPDQIHNFAHNNEWLIRNLIKLGRVSDALSLAKNMTELPMHPAYNSFEKRGSASYGRKRLLDVLNTFEMWEDLIALAETPYLAPTDKESEQINRLRQIGRAHFRMGRTGRGREYLAKLQRRLRAKEAEQKASGNKAAAAAVAAATPGKDKTAASADTKEAGQADATSKDAGEKPATPPCEDKSTDDAAKAKRSAARASQAAERARKDAEKKFVGEIANIRNAISELQGHVALAEKDYDEAIKLLAKGKDFPAEFRAQIEALAGRTDDAIRTAQKNVDGKKNEVRPLATLVQMFWEAKRPDDARKAFEQLREISGSIDAEVPVFAPLTAIATELGLPAEWRVASTVAEDVGDRPELDSLGPFRWQPQAAQPWILPDVHGDPRSLSDYEGRPVIVIFYLGAGCLHCAEQLQAFAPKVQEFEDAGFSVVAISTDTQEKLADSHKAWEDGSFPFPLVADPELNVFREYRVYDDFEKQPLHGTFIVDRRGRVRWQDISYEPFMDPDFVLKEGLRLLQQDQ